MHFSAVSRYRSALMGISILLIMLRHVPLAAGTAPLLLHTRNLLSSCVDVFLLLSGIGLYFSLYRNSSLRQYYLRRFRRIIPTWFVVAGVFYTFWFLHEGAYSASWLEVFGNATINISFWTDAHFVFWFMPCLMVYYLLAPGYMYWLKRTQHNTFLALLPVLILMIVNVFTIPYENIQSLKGSLWCLNRLPVFLLGMFGGRLVMKDRQLPRWVVIISLPVYIFIYALLLHLRLDHLWTNATDRLLYIPLSLAFAIALTVCLQYIDNKLKRSSLLTRILTFLGTISLECYLLHEPLVDFSRRVLHLRSVYASGYLTGAVVSISVVIVLTWLLHKIMKKIS